MHAPKIRVENGRIHIDEPTDLPNGTELYVVPAEQLGNFVLLRDDGLGEASKTVAQVASPTSTNS